MAKVETTKDIYAAHFAELLPDKAVRIIHGESVSSDEVTQEELQAAVEAYSYDQARVDAEQAQADAATSEQESRATKVHNKIEAGIVRLETDAKDQATWDALTPERRSQNMRIACLMAAKLGRLCLRKYDAPES